MAQVKALTVYQQEAAVLRNTNDAVTTQMFVHWCTHSAHWYRVCVHVCVCTVPHA